MEWTLLKHKRRSPPKLMWFFGAVGLLGSLTIPSTCLGQASIERMLEETTKQVYEINCDSLVAEIRADTRMRIGVNQLSIEQINSRREITISDRAASCSGVAVFSNAETARIWYSYYYDENGEPMIEYQLESDLK